MAISNKAFLKVATHLLYQKPVFQTALIPTTNQYNNTVEWLKLIHDSIDKRKISNIVNEEIKISGIAKDVWVPIRGGIKNVYDVAFKLKIVFFTIIMLCIMNLETLLKTARNWVPPLKIFL